MLHRLILKVTKFHFPPPKRLCTVVKTFWRGHHTPSQMLNMVEAGWSQLIAQIHKSLWHESTFLETKKTPEK